MVKKSKKKAAPKKVVKNKKPVQKKTKKTSSKKKINKNKENVHGFTSYVAEFSNEKELPLLSLFKKTIGNILK